jgi:hypothetical protein
MILGTFNKLSCHAIYRCVCVCVFVCVCHVTELPADSSVVVLLIIAMELFLLVRQ